MLGILAVDSMFFLHPGTMTTGICRLHFTCGLLLNNRNDGDPKTTVILRAWCRFSDFLEPSTW